MFNLDMIVFGINVSPMVSEIIIFESGKYGEGRIAVSYESANPNVSKAMRSQHICLRKFRCAARLARNV
jgi:hypothetical protein